LYTDTWVSIGSLILFKNIYKQGDDEILIPKIRYL
jgi:hypothetical protein